jgi:aminopeptidase N
MSSIFASYDDAMRRRLLLMCAAVCVVITAGNLPAPAPAQTTSTIGSSGTGDPYFPLQGNGGYDVQHYDVTFSYDPPTRRMVGSTRITATTTQELSRFNLDFTGLTVREVVVDGAPATFSHQGQELVVTPRAQLTNGRSFTVSVGYDGSPSHVVDPDGSPDGWIVTDDGAYVAGAPQGTMTWFPGNHNLLDKATHTFRVTVPEGTTVMSNGYMVSRVSGGGQTTFHWDSTDPMANYLATATLGRFSFSATRTPLGVNYVAVDPNVGSAANGPVQQTYSIVSGLSAIFGPYPFWVTGGIVDNARFVGYAMETQTKPIYPLPPDTALVVHEMAHQWYGNSVTPTLWRDIWLNEGFATYAEWLWSERNGGTTAQQHFSSRYARAASDPFWQVRPGDPGAVDLFHPAVYSRGAMTLHALRTTVGSRVFFYILRAWADEHRHGHGTTQQFVDLAERLSGRQLDGLFQRWLYQTGKPTFP